MYEKSVGERLIGHDAVLKHIRSAISAGRVSTSRVFDGGRREPARGHSPGSLRWRFCVKLPRMENPAADVIPARVFLSGNHPDMHYIQPGEKGTLPVQRIREELVQDIEILPYSCGA